MIIFHSTKLNNDEKQIHIESVLSFSDKTIKHTTTKNTKNNKLSNKLSGISQYTIYSTDLTSNFRKQ